MAIRGEGSGEVSVGGRGAGGGRLKRGKGGWAGGEGAKGRNCVGGTYVGTYVRSTFASGRPVESTRPSSHSQHNLSTPLDALVPLQSPLASSKHWQAHRPQAFADMPPIIPPHRDAALAVSLAPSSSLPDFFHAGPLGMSDRSTSALHMTTVPAIYLHTHPRRHRLL
ncbi:hypothetical protein PMIN06_007115 [Paraphaeosphaeria minitans]